MILATKWRTIWILTILLFAFAFCFLFRRASFVPELPAMILKMITSPLFVLCWIPVMRLKSLANPFTAFLSKLFLEIYICQGLAFLLLSNKYWNLEGWSFFFSVFPLTILMAWTVKPLTTRFMEWGKNLRNSIKSKWTTISYSLVLLWRIFNSSVQLNRQHSHWSPNASIFLQGRHKRGLIII